MKFTTELYVVRRVREGETKSRMTQGFLYEILDATCDGESFGKHVWRRRGNEEFSFGGMKV